MVFFIRPAFADIVEFDNIRLTFDPGCDARLTHHSVTSDSMHDAHPRAICNRPLSVV